MGYPSGITHFAEIVSFKWYQCIAADGRPGIDDSPQAGNRSSRAGKDLEPLRLTVRKRDGLETRFLQARPGSPTTHPAAQPLAPWPMQAECESALQKRAPRPSLPPAKQNLGSDAPEPISLTWATIVRPRLAAYSLMARVCNDRVR